MAQFVDVPASQLEPDTLNALLEEFASRDGTDYGLRELPLEAKVARLQRALVGGDMKLLFDLDSEHWDLVDPDRASRLLTGEAP